MESGPDRGTRRWRYSCTAAIAGMMARAVLLFLLLPASLSRAPSASPLAGSIGSAFFHDEGPYGSEERALEAIGGAAAAHRRRDRAGQAVAVRAIYFNLGYGLN